MGKFLLSVLIVIAFSGCSSYRAVTAAEAKSVPAEQQIYKIETTNGQVVDFESDPLGHALLKSGGIERLLPDGTVTTIPLNTVKTIYTKETNFLSTTGGIILLSAVVAVVVVFALGGLSFHGI